MSSFLFWPFVFCLAAFLLFLPSLFGPYGLFGTFGSFPAFVMCIMCCKNRTLGGDKGRKRRNTSNTNDGPTFQKKTEILRPPLYF